MDKDFFINNRKKLIDKLEDNSILVLFSGISPYWSGDENYKFSVDKNFFYITGLEEEEYIYIIFKSYNQVNDIMFIPKDYEANIVKFLGHRKDKEHVTKLTGINDVRFLDELYNYFDLNIKAEINKIYISESYEFCKTLKNKLNLVFDNLEFLNIDELFANFRSFKQQIEVENIKEAIKITGKGINSILVNAKKLNNEYELEALFDYEIKKNNVYEKAFHTIVASGANATILHYNKNNCKINNNDLILLDLGVRYNNYCSDISRTFPANGKFTNRQKVLYNIVFKAQKATMESVKIGMTFRELNDVAKKSLIESCKEIKLINSDEDISKYYYHSVSHSLGLDAHDLRDYAKTIEPGMVITVEPGLYVEEEGIGIRIEDDILITEDGYVNLSEDIPKEIEEIETIMNKDS